MNTIMIAANIETDTSIIKSEFGFSSKRAAEQWIAENKGAMDVGTITEVFEGGFENFTIIY